MNRQSSELKILFFEIFLFKKQDKGKEPVSILFGSGLDISFEDIFCFYEDDSGLSDERKREKRPKENIKMT